MSEPRDIEAGLSVAAVIPALDEARSIAGTLDAVARVRGLSEIIVVDGGSADATREIARAHACGARVVESERGRGAQMHAGAGVARAQVLWFLHADTRPPADGVRAITDALADAGAAGGNFGVAFDGDSRPARFMTWLYPRLRTLGLAYGDSAFFVRREAYERAGGFRAFPVFEDLDLVARLRRHGRFVRARGRVVTSSRRFEGRSFLLMFARWAGLQLLYWLGVHPRALANFYGPVRAARARRRRREQPG